MNLKKMFRKNGIIIINSENSIKYNYFLVNNYLKLKDFEKIKIEYLKSIGYIFNP